MENYLSTIQSWFGSGFYGRHLSLVLREIGKRHPKALTSFICIACGIPAKELNGASFVTEFRFQGRQGTRSADLAVLIGDDEIPRVLVEIKYFDKPLSETKTKPAQLDDYEHWQEREPGRNVLLLSREMHNSHTLDVRRWNDLARHLTAHISGSDLVAMLVDYLKEEGIVMQKVDPHKLLKYFKSLTFGRHGAGMLAKNIDGPAEFTKLLRNLQLIASTLHPHFRGAWSSHNVITPSVDFKIHQRLKVPGKTDAYTVGDQFLNNALREGGFVDSHAQYSLGHGRTYLRIRIGLRVYVTGASIKLASPETWLFVEAVGGSLNRADLEYFREQKIGYDMVTKNADVKTATIEKHIHRMLLGLVKDVRGDRNAPITVSQREALTRLDKSLTKDMIPV
ncbi:hypothetical protein SAMN04487926_15328 [Paraburkholderia steynii]|uniref:Uncharacterized protein n=1 Tax=Paraburkholderia steynii TaxID=1245441 RepID=A0A7Z7FP54_9BURK|nr:hypothetical protein [Paraburkholderia steynii]SDJ47372.1 hypothetical protein SAMN04487926_15328 [Paraburkholderia steynii]